MKVVYWFFRLHY